MHRFLFFTFVLLSPILLFAETPQGVPVRVGTTADFRQLLLATKDIHVVQLTRKGGKAVLTFDPTYTKFEAIDFNNQRITGSRQ